jgi:hypothetical protein
MIMKTISKFLNILAAAALAATALSSCDSVDYPDRYKVTDGKPTVYSVRYADRDLTITGAYMDEIICLLGDNLTSVKELWFNDQKAILNTSYITDNTLIVAVPKVLPTVQTDKIYMVNNVKDTVTYDFKVLPPSPVVSSMSFEYAEPGETVTITGSYFYEPMTVEFTSAEATQIKNLTFNSFDVVIPEGALPGKIKVTTESGTGQSAFMYKDNRGMLFTFDDARGNHGWHAQTIKTDENSFSGNYLQLYSEGVQMACDGTDWQDTGYHFEYWPGNWNSPETFDDPDGVKLNDVVDFTDFANMAVKFEMRIPADHPWTGCPMQIYFASTDMVTLSTGNNTFFHDETISLPRALYMPWKATGSFDTGGKWITVSLPISTEFVWYWDGNKASGQLKAETFAGMEIFFAAGAAGGTPCTPMVQIDNIRAVPAK